MTDAIFIVSRTDVNRYLDLKRFWVDVVLDRRFNERRQILRPPTVERRRAERRGRDVTQELQSTGSACVMRLGGVDPRKPWWEISA